MINQRGFVSDHELLAVEWNTSRNSILASEARLGSSKKAWWTCPKGHEYESVICNRTKGSGCSVCSGKTIVPGINDIATTSPELAKEISSKNEDDSLPLKIGRGSNKKIWWNCAQGHEWQATPNNRRDGRSGCPICSNRAVVQGVNDLKTANPKLTREFDRSRNLPLTPELVPANSNAKFWWKCDKAHSWQASLSNRVKGTGCPFCSGRQASSGLNDLASLNPSLAAEWHPELNNGLTPTNVKSMSGKKVWWICSLGHPYQAKIIERSNGNGCNVCAGVKVLSGANDLLSQYPTLVSELVNDERQNLDPEAVFAGGRRKLLWKCSFGHQWVAAIEKRIQGQQCPFCGNKRLLDGFNDLATTHPQIALEFDFDKNYPLLPNQIIGGTNKQIWWVCAQGHSWRTTGSHRIFGRGCPTCATTGYNPTQPGLLYFIENTTLGAKKVGITNIDAKTDRLNAFRRAGWSLIASFASSDGKGISDAETILLRWIRKELGLPQYLDAASMVGTGGASETISGDVNTQEVLIKIKQVLKELGVKLI